MKKDVGVVIIARDEEHNIGDCLASLRQTGADPILVVVDSRAKDNTAEIAREYTSLVTVADGNRGRLRNVGYRKLGLPYVAFVDADMRVTPGYLETLRKTIGENPKLALVGGAQTPLGCCFLGAMECEYLNYKRAVGTAGGIYRVEALNDVGGFRDELNVGEDGDLSQRLINQGWQKKWIGTVTIGHYYVSSTEIWRNKMTHGAAAGFGPRGLLRLAASPIIGAHAAWVRRQLHMIWYMPMRSLTLLVGKGVKREYTPTPSHSKIRE